MYLLDLQHFNCHSLPFDYKAPSAAPTGLTVDLISSTTVSLQWDALDEDNLNGVLQNYEIELENIETGQTAFFTTAQPSIDIDSLHPYYNYLFCVKAVTASSGPEAEVTFQMPEDGEENNMRYIYSPSFQVGLFIYYAVPSGSPRAVVATAVTSTTVVIVWNLPEFDLQNGFVRYYNVSVVEQMTGKSIWFLENDTQITVNGLHPYHYYSVQVAMATIGIGPFSEPVLVQLMESGKK